MIFSCGGDEPSWPTMSSKLDGVKAEVLAARADGLGDVLGLGGGHHEDDVVGRLFEGFEEGVEGGVGDLVGLVEEVDLVFVARRAVRAASRSSRISSMPRLVAASISMTSTALPEGISGQDRSRCRAQEWGARGADGVAAVEGRGQDAGDGRFADAAVAGEDVAVGDAVLGEALSSVRVTWSWPATSEKSCGAVFAGENLIGHLSDR